MARSVAITDRVILGLALAPAEPKLVERCPKHDTLVGVYGCRLRASWQQPAP